MNKKENQTNEQGRMLSPTRKREVSFDEQVWIQDAIDDFVSYLKKLFEVKECYMKEGIVKAAKVELVKRLILCSLGMSLESRSESVDIKMKNKRFTNSLEHDKDHRRLWIEIADIWKTLLLFKKVGGGKDRCKNPKLKES